MCEVHLWQHAGHRGQRIYSGRAWRSEGRVCMKLELWGLGAACAMAWSNARSMSMTLAPWTKWACRTAELIPYKIKNGLCSDEHTVNIFRCIAACVVCAGLMKLRKAWARFWKCANMRKGQKRRLHHEAWQLESFVF
eukprot:350539-Chlamydomonas_euryale.AAC.1